ncbi:hypothetical protein [Lewinella sp. LCG006]|uniref:hypothetical protein n=1 Tax=Lewinella sp. LCG006 TaxID=3231911 RepID=UPI00345F6C57
MVNEKKVSIKYFLNNRIKGEEYNGEIYHPLYARINFLGNNTKIRVSDRYDKLLFITEKDFGKIEPYLDSDPIEKGFLKHGKGGLDILNHELIIKKAIKRQYKIDGENFSFPVFTENLKFWQKDIYSYLKKELLEYLKEFSSSNLELNKYNSINFQELITTDAEFVKWQNLTAHQSLPKWLEINIKATISYLAFKTQMLYWHNAKAYNSVGEPTVKGTVFSWLFEDEKDQFSKELQGNLLPLETNYTSSVSRHLSSEFVKQFAPLKSEAELYVRELVNIFS